MERQLKAQEEVILVYLYDHPQGPHSTQSLTTALANNFRELVAERNAPLVVRMDRPHEQAAVTEQAKEAAKKAVEVGELEVVVESLITKRLARGGKRIGEHGNITHTDIRLTDAGERAAIAARQPKPRIVLDFVKTSNSNS